MGAKELMHCPYLHITCMWCCYRICVHSKYELKVQFEIIHEAIQLTCGVHICCLHGDSNEYFTLILNGGSHVDIQQVQAMNVLCVFNCYHTLLTMNLQLNKQE